MVFVDRKLDTLESLLTQALKVYEINDLTEADRQTNYRLRAFNV